MLTSLRKNFLFLRHYLVAFSDFYILGKKDRVFRSYNRLAAIVLSRNLIYSSMPAVAVSVVGILAAFYVADILGYNVHAPHTYNILPSWLVADQNYSESPEILRLFAFLHHSYSHILRSDEFSLQRNYFSARDGQILRFAFLAPSISSKVRHYP